MRNIRAMSTTEGATPNTDLGNLVRTTRTTLGMTQEDLAAEVGKTRQWVIQVEKGIWNNGGKRVSLTPENAIKLGLALGRDVQDFLLAGEVPIEKWPDLSHISSKTDKVRLIDITSLTPHQQALIESIVHELKHQPTESDPT